MTNKAEIINVPDNFQSIIVDFSTDLSATFPEYSYLWSKWINPDISEDEINTLFEYCLKVYPERFFDILYQNDDMFQTDSEINTYFLPNVSFRLLFNTEDITENTKKAMWKYLQLILFTIVGCVKDKSNFGDTMNVFDGIDENELQDKLKDAMGGISDFFSKMEANNNEPKEEKENETTHDSNPEDDLKNAFENMKGALPNIEKMHEHLKGLFEGKIGSLAKEMAEEIAGEFSDILGDDSGDMKNTSDVIKKLMKNPQKIMELMKTVGAKLDDKMKNGNVSREELMKEASEMMSKMKEAGGGRDFDEMFKEMAKNMGGLGKNMRLDTNAMNRMTKMQESKDRIRKAAEIKKQQREEEIRKQVELKRKQLELQAKFSLNPTDKPNNFVFKLDDEEGQEKSFIHPDLLKEMETADKKKENGSTENKKKKKKNKK
jgi:hypothetical protein